jgi:hypothetical protein
MKMFVYIRGYNEIYATIKENNYVHSYNYFFTISVQSLMIYVIIILEKIEIYTDNIKLFYMIIQ